jgi:antitoxin component HigA of HigAB toxin-antitoxin module
MNIHPIRTKADYQAAHKEISALVDLDPALESTLRLMTW